MSLYIGNLSSRTRRGELERVFQRFGQCDVRLKDGYGFVVYVSAPNAERALTALQGRDICGKPLTIMWSNKQPRPPKRFSKAATSYGPPHGRNSARGRDHTDRNLHSHGRLDYKSGIKRLGSASRQVNSADMLDNDTSYHQERIKGYIREENCDYREDFPDEGGNVERSRLDNDRRGGQLHDQPSGNSVENCRELDQFEHYRGYDQKAEDENHHMAYSDSSQVPQSLQEIMGREHFSEVPLDPQNDDSECRQTCYSCGGTGHKMRNCPRENSSQSKFIGIVHRHDDDIDRGGRAEGKLEKYGSGSQGKKRSYRDSLSMSGLGDDRKRSGSVNHQNFTKTAISSEAKEVDRVRRKDHGRKRRRKRHFGNPNEHTEKKTKRSVPFSLHSDYTESRSYLTSQSPKPVPRSGLHSRSRSVSSQLQASTYNSRSSSTSQNTRSTRTKSRPRSRSNSQKSLSLSLSVGRPLPSSSNKVQSNPKGTLANVPISECKEIIVEQTLSRDAELESAGLESNMLAVKAENVVLSSKLENDVDKNEPLQRDWNDNLLMSTSLHDIANSSTLLSEKGTLTSRSLSSETFKEMREHQNYDASMMAHIPPPAKDSASEAPVCFHSACSTSISSEEMHMVLKHYGQELHDENERSLSPEAYFGSARLWPWEIIYYRRLKKGPISTENYARRVAQNQEFGIVDKFVRSSSGWGELSQEYP
ncbi:putative Splicing factor, arginine/serine-rich [Melia azedarach]|uniref:Splicing factor, arginine/serine-rich n=1 Tax=Melia azedarach TaxID=155640 RepID=A0ACC1X1U2_MELAZ|nr:putative Splicing factor, arginine/serine-rich [Melia azedarach]